MADDVRFTRMADGREVAYRVVSDTEGPVIAHTQDTTFPMEMLDEDPMYDRFLRTLGQAGTLVVFDKPGVGAGRRWRLRGLGSPGEAVVAPHAAAGDIVWRATLDRYETIVARTVEHHHGTLVKHIGDGALATFPSGSQAIDAATELGRATQDLGLDGRTGIHVGEVEQRNGDIGGIAVHLASRVMGEADPGQIVVTSALEQVTIGTRFRFDDLGPRTLKGIDRPWNLFSVDLPR